MIKGKFPMLLLFALISAVCADDDITANQQPLWKPSVGDFWTYHVTVDVAKDTKLPTGIPGQKIEELDGKRRATYEQTAVYRGLLAIPDDGREAHAFYFSNGDQLEEIQYMSIEKDSVNALGSKQEGKQPKKAVSLSEPIPLVDAAWKGGEAFPVIMDQKIGDKKLRMTRQFRAIGWEELETPAGSFKALHVQVVGMNGNMEIKRGYWFVPGTGFVKEVKKYYLEDKMILTQTKELKLAGQLEAHE